MIRMIQSSSPGHAKAYFSDALLRSDYYTNDQELTGFWQGKLADRLGLTGATSKEDFFALCENINPQTGESLTLRTKEGRRVGYDINFHCPKSVSILHAFAKDDHILKAFQESVTETMLTIEADANTRVRKGGQYADRKTGELIWSHFLHQTARPVEGELPDPHLHSHCFTFNATWDETEKQLKAGEFATIKRDMPFYQAQFHKILSDKLMNVGYGIRTTDKSFEIEGVPKRVIDLFSKRTDEIGRIAKDKGITDAKELDKLGSRTRAKKQKGTSMEELKEEWREQMNELPKDKGEGEAIVRHAPKKEDQRFVVQDCVDHALLHCFERASVMADRKILANAYKHSIGQSGATIKDISQTFIDDKRIIHIQEGARTLCTTREVLAEEKRMVELARQGQGKMQPLYQTAPELSLTGQQAAAAEHVLTTPHRVSIIRGAAGTGKTTLTKEVVSFIEKAGKQVTIVAPTAQASRGVLKQEGFEQAETVSKLLIDKKMQEGLKGNVLIVDEAGLLGTTDTVALLELAKVSNARVIFLGDTRQHASVVRGDALRILNTVAGIQTAEVSKIYRQRNEQYRAAVEDLSKGDIAEGFAKLDAIDAIQTIDPLKLSETLVNDYMAIIKEGKSGLIISPTHAQGEEVTDAIRKRLKEEGIIAKKEFAATQFANINFTEAERKDFRNIEAGQMIQFKQNIRGISRGSKWLVESADDDKIKFINAKGQMKLLNTSEAKSFDVFKEKEIHLSKGDKIRITHNGFDKNNKRLNNGDVLEVISVSKKKEIVLRNEISKVHYTIDKTFGHVAHAHCITSYTAQAKTVDEIFIAQPAGTFEATDAKQFYVSVSRGRDRARIYTDDKEALLEHASELGERQSAIELVDDHSIHKNVLMRMEFEKQNGFTNTKEKTFNHLQKQREEYEPDI